jgi:hypothetical protein
VSVTSLLGSGSGSPTAAPVPWVVLADARAQLRVAKTAVTHTVSVRPVRSWIRW